MKKYNSKAIATSDVGDPYRLKFQDWKFECFLLEEDWVLKWTNPHTNATTWFKLFNHEIDNKDQKFRGIDKCNIMQNSRHIFDTRNNRCKNLSHNLNVRTKTEMWIYFKKNADRPTCMVWVQVSLFSIFKGNQLGGRYCYVFGIWEFQ